MTTKRRQQRKKRSTRRREPLFSMEKLGDDLDKAIGGAADSASKNIFESAGRFDNLAYVDKKKR